MKNDLHTLLTEFIGNPKPHAPTALVERGLLYSGGPSGEWTLTQAGNDLLGLPEDWPMSPVTHPDYVAEQERVNSQIPTALDEQVGGSHYKDFKIQPAEFIEKNNLPFLDGCVIKRMCRHGNKNGAEDLRKAIHEIKLILQLRYGVSE